MEQLGRSLTSCTSSFNFLASLAHAQVFFSFILFVIDTVGRKKPLMFGAGSFVVTYSVLTAIVASFPPDQSSNHAAQRAGIAMIFMTSIFFSVSFGPVSWALASEVFPTRTRSIGTSVATCANWAFNVLFSQVSTMAMNNVGWKYYLLFIILNAIDFVVIALLFPETKGMYDQLQHLCFATVS